MAHKRKPRHAQKAFQKALKRIAAVRESGATRLDLSGLGLQSVPAEIGQLEQLRELDLGSNQLTTLPEAVGNLTALQTLRLDHNQLTTLPEAVGKLTALQTLRLDYNQLTTLPEAVGKLTALQTFQLDSNRLTTLPEAVGELTALQTLSLDLNQLTTLPEVVGNLTALQTLSLNFNQLTTLSEVVGKLTALHTLSLIANQLTTLPEAVGELTALQMLFLNNNRLATLPKAVGKLGALQALDVADNQLTTLPEAIGNLTALQTLHLGSYQLRKLPEAAGKVTAVQSIYLWNNRPTTLTEGLEKLTALEAGHRGSNDLTTRPETGGTLAAYHAPHGGRNQLATLPEAVGKLTALHSLCLQDNQLKTLPEAVGKLTALHSLYLENNQLTTLPESVGELTALHGLYLQNNQLTTLPEGLRDLPNLRALFLHGNDGLALPPEVLGPPWNECKHFNYDGTKEAARPPDILNYYFSLLAAKARGKTRRLNEAKLLLVGQGAVGKTSLVRRLTKDEYDAQESKTEGIGRTAWEIDSKHPGEKVALNVWDFGGQEIMHATHQFFLTKRSLYLVVLDARKGENEGNIHYWLRIIRTFGADSPVIVVTNKVDGPNDLLLNETRLGLDYPNVKGFVKTSCATGRGIKDLEGLIVEQVHSLGHVFDELPESHFEIKRALVARAMRSNYLGEEEYRTLCVEHDVNARSQQDRVLRLLHDLGTVLNYNDPDDCYHLNDGHILDPEWVTGGVYRLLNNHELFQGHGVLRLHDLGRFLTDEAGYPKDRRAFIIGMMKRFQLCFDMPGTGDPAVLIPELLIKDEPHLTWGAPGTLRFEYHYDVLPAGVLPRFIVLSHPKHERPPTYWRSGVVLVDEGCRILVRGDTDKARVVIHVQALTPKKPARLRLALKTARLWFDQIHQTIQARAMVPLPDDPNAPAVEYAYLCQLEQEEGSDYSFKPPGASRKYTLRELLDCIEEAEQRQRRDGRKEGAIRRMQARGQVMSVNSAPDPGKRAETAKVASYQVAALPLHKLIVVVFGLLALACIGGGVYAIYANAQSSTEFSLLGARLTTAHVGVAFIGIGLLVALFTVRSVLRNARELAALPVDRKGGGSKKP